MRSSLFFQSILPALIHWLSTAGG